MEIRALTGKKTPKPTWFDEHLSMFNVANNYSAELNGTSRYFACKVPTLQLAAKRNSRGNTSSRRGLRERQSGSSRPKDLDLSDRSFDNSSTRSGLKSDSFRRTFEKLHVSASFDRETSHKFVPYSKKLEQRRAKGNRDPYQQTVNHIGIMDTHSSARFDDLKVHSRSITPRDSQYSDRSTPVDAIRLNPKGISKFDSQHDDDDLLQDWESPNKTNRSYTPNNQEKPIKPQDQHSTPAIRITETKKKQPVQNEPTLTHTTHTDEDHRQTHTPTTVTATGTSRKASQIYQVWMPGDKRQGSSTKLSPQRKHRRLRTASSQKKRPVKKKGKKRGKVSGGDMSFQSSKQVPFSLNDSIVSLKNPQNYTREGGESCFVTPQQKIQDRLYLIERDEPECEAEAGEDATAEPRTLEIQETEQELTDRTLKSLRTSNFNSPVSKMGLQNADLLLQSDENTVLSSGATTAIQFLSPKHENPQTHKSTGLPNTEVENLEVKSISTKDLHEEKVEVDQAQRVILNFGEDNEKNEQHRVTPVEEKRVFEFASPRERLFKHNLVSHQGLLDRSANSRSKSTISPGGGGNGGSSIELDIEGGDRKTSSGRRRRDIVRRVAPHSNYGGRGLDGDEMEYDRHHSRTLFEKLKEEIIGKFHPKPCKDHSFSVNSAKYRGRRTASQVSTSMRSRRIREALTETSNDSDRSHLLDLKSSSRSPNGGFWTGRGDSGMEISGQGIRWTKNRHLNESLENEAYLTFSGRLSSRGFTAADMSQMILRKSQGVETEGNEAFNGSGLFASPMRRKTDWLKEHQIYMKKESQQRYHFTQEESARLNTESILECQFEEISVILMIES